MELLDNFNDSFLARKLLDKIRGFKGTATIMEVCGTHTVAIFKTGLRSGLPKNIRLISGPGCPVCVTPQQTIEVARELACQEGNILLCFGDMMLVPGIKGSLASAVTERGAGVKLMYSPIEALDYAKDHKDKKVILFGVGFETTIPLFASVLLRAKEEKIDNIYLLPAFKLIPPALETLLASDDVKVDGFMLPGHVSAIIGEEAYKGLSDKYGCRGVITGFERVDILEGIALLLDMISEGSLCIKNQYSRFVSLSGNTRARDAIYAVFKDTDTVWRGLGKIPKSGLMLKEPFMGFDVQPLVNFEIGEAKEAKGCICADVIKGKSLPTDCKLYKRVCTPQHPIGPCMVSSEGTCAAYYKYGE